MQLSLAQAAARKLMDQHGLQYWHFEFDSSKRRFGVCKRRKQTISLSRAIVLLNDESEVLDTILHEIAHAMTPGHHHDFVWKAKCIEIGAQPRRCYSADNVVQPEMSWTGTCPNCKKSFRRTKMSRLSRWQACLTCCKKYARGRWDARFVVLWHRTGQQPKLITNTLAAAASAPAPLPWESKPFTWVAGKQVPVETPAPAAVETPAPAKPAARATCRWVEGKSLETAEGLATMFAQVNITRTTCKHGHEISAQNARLSKLRKGVYACGLCYDHPAGNKVDALG